MGIQIQVMLTDLYWIGEPMLQESGDIAVLPMHALGQSGQGELDLEARTISLAPEPRARDGSSNQFAWIFLASLVVHSAIAGTARFVHSHVPAHVVRSSIEVEAVRPKPPPVVHVAEPPKPVEPVKPVVQQKPVARPLIAKAAHLGVTGGSVPEGDAPNVEATPEPTATAEIVAPPPVATVQVAPAPPPPPPPPVIEAREGVHARSNPQPAYPHVAQREGWEGTVLLRIFVLPDGHAGSVVVQKSSGHGVLDDAAVEAAKAGLYEPATQGGRPVAGWATRRFTFNLQ